MNIHRLLLLFLLLFMPFLPGCKKKDKGNASSGTMTATVNGYSFTAATTTVSISGGNFVLTGYNDSQRVQIEVKGYYISTMAYGIDGSTNTALYTSNTSAAQASSGEITIKNNSVNEVTGTFNFTQPLSLQVTEGAFDVKY